ncbi:hypothetical protein H4R99_001325 [Coemansia sp. RSA 1722]|nr:hypothetical protein LPJ57_000927 [Coemansia sp. RSA 486]KAJ2237108.1 hypothetical protein IWW45_001226 [Coemansia sp. RSA 485]KAJ2597764.1 hypothetical protein GGF39_002910 [Coemansia sp. RSA 1721]KAJ2605156.1 hypothetical protein H4R99_001325 [Coemansia sp. RSA 1722]KAJ2638639.1 hypothetical protein GGF40_001483 [Coemansia sp. RSA 1286]
MEHSLKKSRHQKQQQQQQHQQAKSRRKSKADVAPEQTTMQMQMQMPMSMATVVDAGAAGEANAELESGELSPQSRRRQQSRKSSARLRERQRQRIHNAEEEVTRLEGYIQALQQTIDAQRCGKPANPSSGSDAAVMGGPSQAVVEWGDDETRRTFNSRVGQLVLSLSDAVHQLGGCVERIDVLKTLLTERIMLTERKIRGEETPCSMSSSSQISGDAMDAMDAMDVSPPPYSQLDDNSGCDVTRTGSGLGGFVNKDSGSVSGSVSGNNSSTYSGTGSGGSATLGGSVGSQYGSPMTGSAPRKAARADSSSRIPISFLVDRNESNSDDGMLA